MKTFIPLFVFLGVSLVTMDVYASCTRPTVEVRPVGDMMTRIGRLCPIHVYVPEGDFTSPSFDIDSLMVTASSGQLIFTAEIVGKRTADYIGYGYEEDCSLISHITEVSYTEYILNFEEPLPASSLLTIYLSVEPFVIYTSADLNEEGCEQPYTDPMEHRCYPPMPNSCDSINKSTNMKDASTKRLDDAGLRGDNVESGTSNEIMDSQINSNESSSCQIDQDNCSSNDGSTNLKVAQGADTKTDGSTNLEVVQEVEDVLKNDSEYSEENLIDEMESGDANDSKMSGCQIGQNTSVSRIWMFVLILIGCIRRIYRD